MTSSPTPTNKKLYNKVKEEAKSKFKNWPSAYGSQWLVKTYKSRGGTYSGKKTTNEGVSRWNKEKWKDEKGNICGSSKNKNVKKCRPTVRVSPKTPKTWSEIENSGEKKKVVSEKKKVGMGRRTSSLKKTSPKRKPISPKRKPTSPKRKPTSPKRKPTSPKRKN